jgi:hypothetical protein
MALFVKLFGDQLLRSTLWECGWQPRLVFIGMLALADDDGEINAPKIETLARLLNLSVADTAAGLAVLEAPDPESRSQEQEGRRVVKDGAVWRLVNYRKYRESRTLSQVKGARRAKAHRDRVATAVTRHADLADQNQNQKRSEEDGEGEGEARASTPPPRAAEPARVELPDASPRSSRPGGDLAAWAEVETAIQAAYDGTGIAPPLALSAAQKAAACAHARQVARTHGVDLYEAARAIGEVSSRAPSAKERVFALSQEDPWAARAAKRDPEMAHLARPSGDVPEPISVIEHVRRLAAAK